MRPISHEIEQGADPGAQRLGRQTQKSAVGLGQEHIHCQFRNGGRLAVGIFCIGAIGTQLGQQIGQQRQDVVTHAVDFHPQREVEPRRRAAIVARIARGIERHVQRIAARNPAIESGIEADFETGVAQGTATAVDPVQPGLLAAFARNMEVAVRVVCIDRQAQGPQSLDELGFLLHIAVQQDVDALVVRHQYGYFAVRPEAAHALVIEAQACVQQAHFSHAAFRDREQVQAGDRRHALHHGRRLEYGRQGQSSQSGQQRGLVSLNRLHGKGRRIEQLPQVLCRDTGCLHRAALVPLQVQVQRRVVGKQFGTGDGNARLQRPLRLPRLRHVGQGPVPLQLHRRAL